MKIFSINVENHLDCGGWIAVTVIPPSPSSNDRVPRTYIFAPSRKHYFHRFVLDIAKADAEFLKERLFHFGISENECKECQKYLRQMNSIKEQNIDCSNNDWLNYINYHIESLKEKISDYHQSSYFKDVFNYALGRENWTVLFDTMKAIQYQGTKIEVTCIALDDVCYSRDDIDS